MNGRSLLCEMVSMAFIHSQEEMKEAEALSRVMMHEDWSAGDGCLQLVVLQHPKIVKEKVALFEVIAKRVENRSLGDQVEITQVLLFHF